MSGSPASARASERAGELARRRTSRAAGRGRVGEAEPAKRARRALAPAVPARVVEPRLSARHSAGASRARGRRPPSPPRARAAPPRRDEPGRARRGRSPAGHVRCAAAGAGRGAPAGRPSRSASSPPWSSVSPVSIRRSVVLPAPFGPASAIRSRRSSVNETPSNRSVARELLAQVGGDENGHAARRVAGRRPSAQLGWARQSAAARRSSPSFAFEVAEVGLGVDRPADDAGERLLRSELAAVAVEVLAAASRAARRTRRPRSARRGRRSAVLRRLPDLDGHHVPERSTWGSSRTTPPDQWMSCSTPRASSGTVEPEVLAHPRVPGLRQVARASIRPVDHLLLELEAEDDVQVVGRLVGLDADQRGPHRLIAR